MSCNASRNRCLQTGLGYGKLLHGEAVAIGTHMAAELSCRMGWVDRELVDRTVKLMERAGLLVELPKGGGMDMDKFLNVSLASPVRRLILTLKLVHAVVTVYLIKP